jgi:RNA polymerase sigma factor (sigma-70 family)
MAATIVKLEEAALFREWTPFADKIAAASWRGLGLSLDDRRSLAREGLLRAIRTFDGSRGVPFKAWARTNVNRFLRDGVSSWLSLRQAKKTNLTRDDVEALWASWCGPYLREDEDCRRLEALDAVRVALGALNDRSRVMLVAMYFHDADGDEAAALIGLSKSWGSRLHKQALATCRAALAAGAPI